jgi:hypothetical protein
MDLAADFSAFAYRDQLLGLDRTFKLAVYV